jgi:hypothetical protein
MYKIELVENLIFHGGMDLVHSQWNDIPQVPIQKITYTLFNRIVELRGYEAYNHLVERSRFIDTGKEIISKVILLTKKDNNLMAVIFDLINKRVYCEPRDIETFYSTKGWKEGSKRQDPTCIISYR